MQAPKFVQKLEDQELDEGDSLTIECKKSTEAITAPKFVKGMYHFAISKIGNPKLQNPNPHPKIPKPQTKIAIFEMDTLEVYPNLPMPVVIVQC